MSFGRVAIPDWHKSVTRAPSAVRAAARNFHVRIQALQGKLHDSAGACFHRADDILRLRRPEFLVSKRNLCQAGTICSVREKREAETRNLGFSSRPFVLCGLPVKRPAA